MLTKSVVTCSEGRLKRETDSHYAVFIPMPHPLFISISAQSPIVQYFLINIANFKPKPVGGINGQLAKKKPKKNPRKLNTLKQDKNSNKDSKKKEEKDLRVNTYLLST